MLLSSKKYEEKDQPFFLKLIEESPLWQQEEGFPSELLEYRRKYEMMNGQWEVWYEGPCRIGLTFTVDWAPSNEKAWLGTILVDGQARKRGYGKAIVHDIARRYEKEGHDVLFTAVPLQRLEWMQFFAACEFEQLKVEEDEQKKPYMIMTRPLA
ncbi:GNAT family N-acetyltransferase [Bacillus songklensis]|uniref:GNAT family N-acetyltransferase n=1 Tax=Bacillus songklensis TaxID=1069116 RepID=A0ABV8B3L4_9BACI